MVYREQEEVLRTILPGFKALCTTPGASRDSVNTINFVSTHLKNVHRYLLSGENLQLIQMGSIRLPGMAVQKKLKTL